MSLITASACNLLLSSSVLLTVIGSFESSTLPPVITARRALLSADQPRNQSSSSHIINDTRCCPYVASCCNDAFFNFGAANVPSTSHSSSWPAALHSVNTVSDGFRFFIGTPYVRVARNFFHQLSHRTSIFSGVVSCQYYAATVSLLCPEHRRRHQ